MVDTSQTLFDPWSFAHALVGVIQFGVTQWLFAPILSVGYHFNVAIHCAWEFFENTPWTIQKCRFFENDYKGDSTLNVGGDILSFTVGYVVSWTLLQLDALLVVSWACALLATHISFWPGMPLSPDPVSLYDPYVRRFFHR